MPVMQSQQVPNGWGQPAHSMRSRLTRRPVAQLATGTSSGTFPGGCQSNLAKLVVFGLLP